MTITRQHAEVRLFDAILCNYAPLHEDEAGEDAVSLCGISFETLYEVLEAISEADMPRIGDTLKALLWWTGASLLSCIFACFAWFRLSNSASEVDAAKATMKQTLWKISKAKSKVAVRFELIVDRRDGEAERTTVVLFPAFRNVIHQEHRSHQFNLHFFISESDVREYRRANAAFGDDNGSVRLTVKFAVRDDASWRPRDGEGSDASAGCCNRKDEDNPGEVNMFGPWSDPMTLAMDDLLGGRQQSVKQANFSNNRQVVLGDGNQVVPDESLIDKFEHVYTSSGHAIPTSPTLR